MYPHTLTPALLAPLFLLCFGFTLSSLPLCAWALLPPFPLRTVSRFRMWRQRRWA